MPRLNRNRKCQPAQSIRVTRARSRLNDAPGLMTGLDQRGRPIDPLTAEPHNLTATQVLSMWRDEERQRMEQRELEQQNPRGSHSGDTSNISTLSPPPTDILFRSPPPNISRLLNPTRTPSNAPTPRTQADDSRRDSDAAGQLSADDSSPTDGALGVNESNDSQNEEPAGIAVPSTRINDLSPEFAILGNSSSPVSNNTDTSRNLEHLPGPSSRVPLSELDQNDLNSRRPAVQPHPPTDGNLDRNNESQESNRSPLSDQENITVAPNNPNTQSDEQSSNSGHNLQTSSRGSNGGSGGSSSSSNSSGLPPLGNLFAPRGIPSASGLPPDWRPGRQSTGVNMNPETSSRSGSGGSNATTSSGSESTQRDSNQGSEGSRGNRGNRDDSPGPGSAGAQLGNQQSGIPSPEENRYPRRSHGTQTEGPCRGVTYKRRRSDDDEGAGAAPQTKRHASGGNQTSEDREHDFIRSQLVSSDRIPVRAEEETANSSNTFSLVNHTNIGAESLKAEVPGEIPGQYGTSIRPRMSYDWWEQYHIFGVDCIRVHKCHRGVCHECHATWHNDWAKYFKEEEELQIASEDTDHSVQVIPEQILTTPMGKSLRLHPARAAKQRLLELRAK